MDKAGCNERAAVNEKEKRIEGAFQREKETQASQKRYEAEGVKMANGINIRKMTHTKISRQMKIGKTNRLDEHLPTELI